ncbi:hypothetical protein ACROYT_G006109 [Oculina patagonica]
MSSNLPTPQIKQQLFDFSSDSHSQAQDGDQSILPGEEKQNLKLKKKKQKTARIVPSRYMANKPKASKKVTVNKEVPTPSIKKKVKASTSAPTRSKDQSFITHSNNSTLNLDIYTPFMRHTPQQKGIVTSTPADGMVGVAPPVPMGAPTPILPQGIATSSKPHHSGSGGTGAIKKTSRDKQKTQTALSKKTAVKTTGSSQAVLQTVHVTAKPPVPTEVGHTGASTEEGDISQRQLELQYSRVMQAAFLYSRVTKSSNL